MARNGRRFAVVFDDATYRAIEDFADDHEVTVTHVAEALGRLVIGALNAAQMKRLAAEARIVKAERDARQGHNPTAARTGER